VTESGEEVQKVNTQPTPADEQKPGQDLSILSVAQLEERREQVRHGIEKIFHTICGMALMAAHIEPQFLKVIALETTFHEFWEDLEEISDAIRTYAALAQYNEQQGDKLAQLLREGLPLLQAFDEVSPLWLAQRDAFVAQVNRLLEDDEMVAEHTEKGITPP
jgi:hypothetical protein